MKVANVVSCWAAVEIAVVAHHAIHAHLTSRFMETSSMGTGCFRPTCQRFERLSYLRPELGEHEYLSPPLRRQPRSARCSVVGDKSLFHSSSRSGPKISTSGF